MPSPVSPEPALYEKTVLLIEEDRDSRAVYGAVLRRAGFRVLEAADGGESLERARRYGPDLIVMDIGLPRVDGWTATEALKADPATAAIPVVAVTVHVQDFHRGRADFPGNPSPGSAAGDPPRAPPAAPPCRARCRVASAGASPK